MVLAFVTALAIAQGSGGVPACVQVASQARYIPYGYNHVVTITNGCARPVACAVSTDVNPDVQNVEVAKSSSLEVTTFLGAASQTFTARVTCKQR